MLSIGLWVVDHHLCGRRRLGDLFSNGGIGEQLRIE
jgi:hypothetical protein